MPIIPTAIEKNLSLNLAINASDFNLGRTDKVYKIIIESITLFTVTKLLTPPSPALHTLDI